MEVVGFVSLVASTIDLSLSALQTYRDLFKFIPQVRALERLTLKESIKFRVIVERCLYTIDDPDQVRKMLEDPESSAWSDDTISVKVLDQLGPVADTLSALINAYNENMLKTSQELQQVSIAQKDLIVFSQSLDIGGPQ
jgi:hypothetical protein